MKLTKFMTRASLLTLVLLAGCEKIQRGDPGTPGYIAPDFRKVKIVFVQEPKVIEAAGRVAAIQPYTTIEDDRGRRYVLKGVHGKVDETFEADVSLLQKVTP